MHAPIALASRPAPYLGPLTAERPWLEEPAFTPDTGVLEDRLTDDVPLESMSDALEPADYRLLHLRFRGFNERVCAEELERPLDEIKARMARPAFVALQASIERGVLESLLKHGEYEPTTIAKTAAPDAMRRIVRQSQAERDPRTRLAANQAVLKYAGVEPPKRLEITTPDRVIEQMTADELEALAERRVWPARFREVLRAFLPAPSAAPAPPPRPRANETVVEVAPPPIDPSTLT